MGENLQDDEFTIEEAIELELHAINCVLSAVRGPPLFFQLRDRLATLLDQLWQGHVLAEYAELQLEEIRDVRDRWRRDYQIPPD